ncbi:MAG: hypothetical protein M3N52_02725 [Actinomycetota bacterium]|nr:hypothetical protein [Actinomycetota bacterium]
MTTLEELARSLRDVVQALDQLRASLADVVVLQRQTTEDIAELTRAVGHLSDRVGTIEGWTLEERYRTRGHAYFQRIARRLHVLTSDELEALLGEAVDDGVLTDDQADQVRLADLVAGGRRADGEVWLVVEVSWTVDLDDVQRAADRARLLSATGRRALPVVAGKRVHREADEAIHDLGVWRVVNGRADPPRPST